MTTEILRSMLYKGADIIRDIEWVRFIIYQVSDFHAFWELTFLQITCLFALINLPSVMRLILYNYEYLKVAIWYIELLHL